MRLLIIVTFSLFSFFANAQHFLGGNIYYNIDTLNNDFVIDCYADLYYTEVDSIKDSINIFTYGEGIHENNRILGKLNQIQLSNNLYRVTYNAILENMNHDGTGFEIIYKEATDASTINNIDSTSINNIGNDYYEIYIIGYESVHYLNFLFQNVKKLPDFTNEIFQIHTTADSAYIDLKCENPNIDSITYDLYSFRNRDSISLPYFFDLSKDGRLSWDINKTGKYFVPINATQYMNVSVISQSAAILILDLENRDSLNVFSINRYQPKINLSIFPNPTQNTLNLTTKKSLDEIRIYNQSGQLMWQENSISTNQVSIDVSGFSSGIYVVQVRQGEVWQSERFVKE